MKTFDNNDYETARKQYEAEAKERYGETAAYKEHIQKTANYGADKWQQVNEGLDAVLAEFAERKKSGCDVDSDDAQFLVKKLQNYITENYYICTNEILSGLGMMYVADERFKNNIDKYGTGTANFISEAIKIYCS